MISQEDVNSVAAVYGKCALDTPGINLANNKEPAHSLYFEDGCF
jgi:hypothetical protein